MGQFEEDAKAFAARKHEEITEARQLAALSLACGMDLRQALEAPPEARSAIMLKLRHVIERERLKGMRRHWSYDLNRHIALKQVLDRLANLDGRKTRCRVKKKEASRPRQNKRRPKAPLTADEATFTGLLP